MPLGALVGGTFGWRVTFVAVAVRSGTAALGLAVLLPAVPGPSAAGFRARAAVARTHGVPAALGLTVLWIAGAFTVLTYIGPVLAFIGGVRGAALSVWLLVFGVAAVAGNTVGGRAADRFPATALTPVSTGGLTLALAGFGLPACLGVRGVAGAIGCAVVLAVRGVFGWSFMPVQQYRLVALAPEEAGVVLFLNASATYLGIALGSAVGSFALNSAGGTAAVGWTAAAVELCAVLAALAILRARRPADAGGERPPDPVADRTTRGAADEAAVGHGTRPAGNPHGEPR